LEYIVNGAHETRTFETHLDHFIDKYVLCPKCKMPETDLDIKKKTVIVSTCNACGNVTELDSNHRVAVYITKNPPRECDRFKMKAKKAVQKREDELAAEAEKLAIADAEDEEWATDLTGAAVEERLNRTDGAIRDLLQSESFPDTPEGNFERILKDRTSSVPDRFKEIRALQKTAKIGNIQRTSMMFDLLFDKDILTQLAPNAEIVRVVSPC
jgi:hypothetical protein